MPPTDTSRGFNFQIPPLVAAILAVVLAISGAFTWEIIDEDKDGRPDRVIVKPKEKPAVPVAVAVDGPDPDVKPDTPIILDRGAREVAQKVQETPEAFDMAGDLRGTDENGPVAVIDGPLATPNFPGCTTRMLPTNWSNRTVSMSQVDGAGMHYTAGFNRPGLSDMNGLTAYASSPAAGVSWHFLIDAEGHCYYQVPLGKKAWTFGNVNSQSYNIEVIGRGNESTFPAGSPGKRKLIQVVREANRRLGIPNRLGALSNCSVTRSGIVTHWMGGACSGGHHDIRPYSIERLVGQIRNGGCNAKCQRKRERDARVRNLRNRNFTVHRDLRNRRCAPLRQTKSRACVRLHKRHGAIHNAAKKEKVSL
jgi:hypothetical protein